MKNWEEKNCNVYDQTDGSCIKCSERYWKTKEWRCVKVDDQCKTWSHTDGSCTSCYNGYGLSYGKCVVGGTNNPPNPHPHPHPHPPPKDDSHIPDTGSDDNCLKYGYVNKIANKWQDSWFLGC